MANISKNILRKSKNEVVERIRVLKLQRKQHKTIVKRLNSMINNLNEDLSNIKESLEAWLSSMFMRVRSC